MCVRSCFRLDIIAAETIAMLKPTFKEEAVRLIVGFDCFLKCKVKWHVSVLNVQETCIPAKFTEMWSKLWRLPWKGMYHYPNLGNELAVSFPACKGILTQGQNTQQSASKFVPCLLIGEQNQNLGCVHLKKVREVHSCMKCFLMFWYTWHCASWICFIRTNWTNIPTHAFCNFHGKMCGENNMRSDALEIDFSTKTVH